jgi:NAD(P)-dependent dehydrogenase (short-subunit alcohol dehydrogenase family)
MSEDPHTMASPSLAPQRDAAALRDKVAVITGAASGIGLALAHRAAALGMAVVMADIDPDQLAAARRALTDQGAKAVDVVTDVSSAASVDELARTAERSLGAPWLLVNNAGVAIWKRTWDLTHEDWSWVLGVNLFGVAHGIQAFLPGMLERDEGHIVNTASASGLLVSAGASSPYAASKHAVVGLSEVLFRELQALGSRVGVSVLCPGPVATNIVLAGEHRPARFGGATPGPTVARDRYGAESLEPAEVAQHAFDSVMRGRFWILTHPEHFGPSIVRRMEGAVGGQNPDASTADPFHARQPWDAGSRRRPGG